MLRQLTGSRLGVKTHHVLVKLHGIDAAPWHGCFDGTCQYAVRGTSEEALAVPDSPFRFRRVEHI